MKNGDIVKLNFDGKSYTCVVVQREFGRNDDGGFVRIIGDEIDMITPRKNISPTNKTLGDALKALERMDALDMAIIHIKSMCTSDGLIRAGIVRSILEEFTANISKKEPEDDL